MQSENKSYAVTFFLCYLFGILGVHRFYLGKVKTGLLQLITLGGLGIWWLIDTLVIAFGAMKDKNGNNLARIGTVGTKKQSVTFLWSFLGILGLHRFYLGRWKTGLLMLITLGLGGIWWLIDSLMIGAGCLTDKDGKLTQI